VITNPILEKLNSDASPQDVKRFIDENHFPLVDGRQVTFVFVGKAEKVELRHWVYGLSSSIQLNRHGKTDVWHQTLEFPGESRVEYKFGVVRDGNEQWVFDPFNKNVAHDPFGGNSVVHGCDYVDPKWSYKNPGVPEGRFETVKIHSKSFGDERHVRVYIPAKYRDYRRYRLLLVHDGEDYIRFSRLGHVLDNLIHRNEIPPLLVALTNPHDRLREYANDRRHASYIVEELIPELENRFPLINEPGGRCIMGASFGGVASLSTAWHYPGTFDYLLVQSGSFAFTDIGDHARSRVFDPVVRFVNEFRSDPKENLAKQIFISCGVYESLIYENRSMVPFLRSHGFKVKFVEAYDGHNWENWRDRLREGLTWIFPGPLWETYM